MELIALALALTGPMIALGIVRRFRADTLSWAARLSLWGIAAAALAMLTDQFGLTGTLQYIGLLHPTAWSLLWGTAGAGALFVVNGAAMLIQRALKLPVGDRDTFERIAGLTFISRGFVVITASVVEEVLYRGVGVGVGTFLFGSVEIAALVSISAFVGAHFNWKPMHLVQVALAAILITMLYILTRSDLWSCITAHFIVDGIGFLLMPMLLRLKLQRPEQA